MTLDKNLSLTAAISARLFASPIPVEIMKLAAHFEVTAEDIMSAAEEIKKQLDDTSCGIRLKEANGRYSLSTKPEYGESTAAFLDQRRAAFLSNAALETLAIAAYNQPVTKTYISQVRGVASAEVVESLVDKGLLQEAGRLDLPGHPMSYTTTDKFLTVFGLDSLDSLPNQDSFLPKDEVVEEEYVQTSLTDNL